MKHPKFIVAIGTSAGGRNALIELVGQLKNDMDAAFFVVMHLSKKGLGDFLVKQLQPFTNLHCSQATDKASIEKGHIYIAPSGGHLVVKKDQVIIGYGPEENRWRPSIDVLFRSAAAAYNSRVIGIILTGLLNDGTSGMKAVKKSGGICIVQDPDEAEYPDMPLHVLDHMDVDHCVSLINMGELISGLLRRDPAKMATPNDVVAEAGIAERMVVGFQNVKTLGEQSKYACPDCGGGLWEIIENKLTRYRCHVGHSYNEKDLLFKQGENLESTLWVALRMMEERSHLLNKIGNDNRKKGLARLAAGYLDKAKELQEHVDTLKEVLISTEKNAVE